MFTSLDMRRWDDTDFMVQDEFGRSALPILIGGAVFEHLVHILSMKHVVGLRS